MSPLISPESLLGILADPTQAERTVLCDVRWYLADPGRGRQDYDAAHLPGARFVDLHTELAAPVDPDGRGGRHPLPSVADFTAMLGRLGVTPDHRVVAYDAAGGATASRLWWMLRSIGHRADLVQVLDGGIGAWTTAGGATTAVTPTVGATVYPDPGRGWSGTVDAGGIRAALAEGRTVIDARAAERYRGEVEPIDPRAGHVPGAISRTHLDHVGADGRMRPAADLAERFAGLAERPVVYCGSGVTACHDLLALEIAGVAGAELYAGSWSDWVSDPDRPVALGDDPGRVTFRPLRREDLPMLGRWLATPHVARWWEHDPSPEAVEADFGPGIDGDDPVEYHVILLDDRPIGMIQRYRYRDEPAWLAAVSVVPGTDEHCGGIDYLIGEPDLVGRGIGTEAVAAFVADTWRSWPEIVALVVDVDPENRASWRVLERSGFRRVWEGELDSPDPRDHGVSIVLRLDRPA